MKKMLFGVFAATTAVWLFGAGSVAQPQSPNNPGEDEIVVHASRTPQAVSAFVHSVSVEMPSANQLARWNQHICPGVFGATPQISQAVIDQIARRAHAVGLNVGAPGCRADLTIIVTSDSDQVARAIYEQRHMTLTRPNNVDGVTLGEAALRAFVDTPRPVRWWHVSVRTTADGYMMSDQRASPVSSSAQTAAEILRTGNVDEAPTSSAGMTNAVAVRSDGSRLRRVTRQDFSSVLVIVDTTRLNGAPISAVADYIAFVSLAQINPDVAVGGAPSILNLFQSQGTARPTQLTSWDLDYLDGLYHTTRNARNAGEQQSEITRRMSSPPH